MIEVLVAASSPVSRAGLKALLEGLPGIAVAGAVSAAELTEAALDFSPDVILWQLSPDEDAAAALRALHHHNVVLLTSNAAVEMIRAGATGVLLPDATAEQIAVALQAVAAGLGVFPPAHIDSRHLARNSATLTARETEVLRMIAEGLANKEIAWRLGISEHTVKFHVSALLGKLGAATRAEAISAGIRQGAIML
jgi:two-component system nitrate/nitrite response regulator NarL